jgi:hypothetical protein
MQDIKRLKVGAILGNSPSGVVQVNFVPFEGGDFNLSPKKHEDGLVMVDPNRPMGYGFEIVGDADSLKQVANALLAVARNKAGEAEDGVAGAQADA